MQMKIRLFTAALFAAVWLVAETVSADPVASGDIDVSLDDPSGSLQGTTIIWDNQDFFPFAVEG